MQQGCCHKQWGTGQRLWATPF